MTILIFEGIATSGKSTIIKDLVDALADTKIRIAHEDETHVPIMQATSEKHIEFFKDLITKLTNENNDVLIFDRLYLTQAFRAGCRIAEYQEVESLLSNYSTTTIFLKVDPAAITDRIAKAAEHRESNWAEYLKTKGKSAEQIGQYYIDQQAKQLGLLKDSILRYKTFNTTHHEYQEIIKEIKTLIGY